MAVGLLLKRAASVSIIVNRPILRYDKSRREQIELLFFHVFLPPFLTFDMVARRVFGHIERSTAD